MPNDLTSDLHDEVRNEVLGTRAFELAAEVLEGEIEKEREEIQQLVTWERDDLTIKIARMEADGSLLYEQLGDELHRMALAVDRRIAAVLVLQRQSERLHYWDSLVP